MTQARPLAVSNVSARFSPEAVFRHVIARRRPLREGWVIGMFHDIGAAPSAWQAIAGAAMESFKSYRS